MFENRQNRNTNWTYSHIKSCSAYQHYNSRNAIKGCSISETTKTISPSIQTLIEEFKTIVFEKDDLGYPDFSILKALLQLFVNQDSKSDVTEKFHDF